MNTSSVEYTINFLVRWKPKNKGWGGGVGESIKTRASGKELSTILRALRNDPLIENVTVWKETSHVDRKRVGIRSRRKDR